MGHGRQAAFLAFGFSKSGGGRIICKKIAIAGVKLCIIKLGNYWVMTHELVVFCLHFCRRQECSAENIP